MPRPNNARLLIDDQKEMKCKHKWIHNYGDYYTTKIFCERCGTLRVIHDDGYIKYGKNKGVYEYDNQ